MKINKVGKVWIWEGGYETKNMPKAAGLRWNPEGKYWWTQYIDSASKLVEYAEGDAKVELQTYLNEKSASIAQSKAADTVSEIPAPDGLKYLPFQKAGIEYALNHQNVLFGDEMGLGKTIQAIGIINARPEIKKVLVVVKASLKINWKRELEKWLVRPMKVEIGGKIWPDADIVIVNYEILDKYPELNQPWDLLIVDECHFVKNPEAKRTQLLLGYDEKKNGEYIHVPGIIEKCKYRAFLTGTPIPNRPIELFPIVHALVPNVFSHFMGYAKRYCSAYQGRYGWDLNGASHLDELQEKLRANVMVRRLKKDVLTELPPKFRTVIELETNGATEVVKAENEAWERNQANVQNLKNEVELAKLGSDEEYKKAVARLKEGMNHAFGEIAKERHNVALAKVPYAVEHLQEIDHKVIIFGHHHDVIDQIAEALGNTVKVTGRESDTQRDDAVMAFQNDPNVKYIIGSIGAMGVGLTLTAASHVVFVELDWVPGNVTQAEDRAHRIGQKDNVLVEHLVLNGSLDARMVKILIEKQEVADRALDIEPEPVVIPEPGKVALSPAKQRIEKEAEKLTPEQIIKIHRGLKILAARCDGALSLDGMGFNKIDTNIGKNLAYQGKLTPKQAAYGKMLLIKYQGQIGNWEEL